MVEESKLRFEREVILHPSFYKFLMYNVKDKFSTRKQNLTYLVGLDSSLDNVFPQGFDILFDI